MTPRALNRSHLPASALTLLAGTVVGWVALLAEPGRRSTTLETAHDTRRETVRAPESTARRAVGSQGAPILTTTASSERAPERPNSARAADGDHGAPVDVATPQAAVADPRQALEEQWRREPSDRPWTSQLQLGLPGELLAQGLGHASVSAVDCRASVCRLQLEEPLLEELTHNDVANLPVFAGNTITSFLQPTPQGMTIELYLRRATGP